MGELIDSLRQYNRPVPAEEYADEISVYEHGEFYIVEQTKGFIFPEKDSHVHGSYEFILPITDMPYIDNSGKLIHGEAGAIIPVNAGDPHGPAGRMEGVRLSAVCIEKGLMDEVSYSCFGKTDVLFSNKMQKASYRLYLLVKRYIEESNGDNPGNEIMLQSLGCQIAALLLRQLPNNVLRFQSPVTGGEGKRISDVIDFLNEYFNTECTLDKLAGIACLSRYHFIREFKRCTGKTPYEYLMDLRVEKAKVLLLKKDMTITEVSSACGFKNVTYFATFFKGKTGLTPSQFRAAIY